MRMRVLLGLIPAIVLVAPIGPDTVAVISVGGNTSEGKAVPTQAVRGDDHLKVDSRVADFRAFNQPSNRYVNGSCKIDISAIPDFTPLTSVTGCGVTITFSSTMEKRSVPGSWASWGSPPDTEDPAPAVLWSRGRSKVTLTYSRARKWAGLEAQPNPFEVHTIIVEFVDRTGAVHGTISRDVNGDSGARLFAGRTSDEKFESVRVTSTANFGIAQLRVRPGD